MRDEKLVCLGLSRSTSQCSCESCQGDGTHVLFLSWLMKPGLSSRDLRTLVCCYQTDEILGYVTLGGVPKKHWNALHEALCAIFQTLAENGIAYCV